MEMKSFCYWLQGLFELAGPDLTKLDERQTDLIKRHLDMVFIHEIDPSQGNQEHQDKLNATHDGSHGSTSGLGVFTPEPPLPPQFRKDNIMRC